jgi:hypothetical protein
LPRLRFFLESFLFFFFFFLSSDFLSFESLESLTDAFW